MKKSNFPKGTIVIKNPILKDDNIIPGNKTTQILATMALSSSSVLFILLIVLCIFNINGIIPLILAFNFPVWLNWIGIFGIWICYGWGILVMIYNVNYIALFKPIKGEYKLATGGPYSIIRHPMYTEKFFVLIFIFIASGIWISIIWLIFFKWVYNQAKYEELVLFKMFSPEYENYMKQTGRFIPKLQKN